MEKLLVSGVDSASRSAYVEFDDYIPLKFRSYLPPLGGVRDVRLGNQSTSFLELTLGLETTTIRGFTLLCFDAMHSPVPIPAKYEVRGLPILDIDKELFQGRDATQWVDLQIPFSVGLGSNIIEIDFGSLRIAEQALICGSTKFLMNLNSLVGIQVLNLTEQEMRSARSMAVEKKTKHRG